MEKEITHILEVKITNLEVDESYYTFDYIITLDGKKKKKEHYESDYDNGQSPKEWKKFLEKGYALKCVLENFDY